MAKKKLIGLLSLSFLLVGGITAISVAHDEVYTPTFATYTNHDADTYYNGISDTAEGDDLLSALRSLNSSKRKNTIGYKQMANNYQYTDYDIDSVQYDSKGQPYSNKFVAFYSGEIKVGMTGMNKEHVWPDSRGGNLVEADIHMPRPTLSADNSSRGNSFYVENMNSTTSGWDPKYANPCDITYRGDSARIVFYSSIANSNLTVIDETNDNKNNRTMGKLSDLIKWHFQYAPLQREMNRNEGAEYLQGNRNPFIDHPEYVCRIWGNTSDATKALCANDPYAATIPTSITLSDTTVSVTQGKTNTVSVKSALPEGASTKVGWTSNNEAVAAVDSKGVITGVTPGTAVITATSLFDANVKATCTVTVNEPSPTALESIEASIEKATLFQSETSQISVVVNPDETYPMPTYSYTCSDSNVATVSETGLVTALNPGDAVITVTATQGATVKTDTVNISVAEKENVEGTITITKDSFSATGSSYTWADWSVDDVDGEAYVYAGNLSQWIQFNSTKEYKLLANKTELPGDMVSVTVKASKSENTWKLYGDSQVMNKGTHRDNTTIDLGEKNVSTDGATWDIPNSGLRYFSLELTGTGATYLDSIEISYGAKSAVEDKLTAITIKSNPTKLVYEEGEELDLTGLKVEASYTVSEAADVTDKVSANVTTLNNHGTVTVTISYTENGVTRNAAFTITVNERETPPSPPGPEPIPGPGPDPQPVVDEELENAKANAIKALQDYYASFDLTKYNKAGQDALKSALDQGVEKIGQATEIEEVNRLLQSYKTIMDSTTVISDVATKNGCMGNISTTSIILSSLALIGITLILVKKHKKEAI